MSNVISALTNSQTGLSISKLLNSFIDNIPLLMIILPVALGLFFLALTLRDFLPRR